MIGRNIFFYFYVHLPSYAWPVMSIKQRTVQYMNVRRQVTCDTAVSVCWVELVSSAVEGGGSAACVDGIDRDPSSTPLTVGSGTSSNPSFSSILSTNSSSIASPGSGTVMQRTCPVWLYKYCWLGHQTCKNRRPYNLYCVGADVKPCSINQYSSPVSLPATAIAITLYIM